MPRNSRILEGVDRYYTDKVSRFGATPAGVDWNSKESQYLRFEQLCRVVAEDRELSLLDYGCGYGGLLNYLDERFAKSTVTYVGYDISSRMLDVAAQSFGMKERVSFSNA